MIALAAITDRSQAPCGQKRHNPTRATEGGSMFARRLMIPALLPLLCAACATTPEQSADVEYYAPKAYRTGSNIAVKDYGAANVQVMKPDASVAAGYLKRCMPPAGGAGVLTSC
jgi:hypothetical protein